MTPEDKLQMNIYLEKMNTESEPPSKDEPQGRPEGFVPEVCLKPFYKSTTTPFGELIIYREAEKGGWEYLYQERHDQFWDGHGAHGGMVHKGFPAGPVEIAQKLLDREFKGMGIQVRELQIVSCLLWPEHKWCNPFAVVWLIKVDGNVPEGGDRHWLSVKNLPKDMIINHGLYLRQCDYFLRHGSLVFTPKYPDGIWPEVQGCVLS